MADAGQLLATAIDPANLHPNLLRDPNVVQDPSIVGGYQLGDNWYQPQAQPEFVQTPQAQEAGAVPVPVAEAPTNQARTDADEARLEAARQRRQRAREREEERPGLSALLPDEVLVEPPHDPDETVPVPFTRPCSMARPDIPQSLRCVVMLKPDYNYRMCEGCRMRFKLAEVRAKGIRYDGKKKARGTPNESGRQKQKARPQLIQYNGELVLDPAYMHTYDLDPRMFGAEGQMKNMAANEKASFSKALKGAATKLQGSKTKSREGTEEANGQATTPSAPPEGAFEVAGPSSTPGPSNASEEPKVSQPNDGLLRVRICSVKTCHAPVPIDYHWKMCEACRVNYRKWGIEKRDRIRERRLKDMPKEERDRFMTLSKGKKAQHESNLTGGPAIIEIEVPFDPTVQPRRCTVRNCKNHVPGNSGYKRCPSHRKESRVYASSYAKKRELQMEVYQRALDDGLDPEEALKEYMEQMSKRDDTSDEDGEKEKDPEQEGEKPKKKRKSKVKKSTDVIDPILLESPFTTSTEPAPKRPTMPPPSMRRTGDICSGKDCANLLERAYAWRLCELCREADKARRPPPKSKKKGEGATQKSGTPDATAESTGSKAAPTPPPTAPVVPTIHNQASIPQVPIDPSLIQGWNAAYSMNQGSGSIQWLSFNPPPTYRTPESSLQHAITPPAVNSVPSVSASASSSSNPPTEPVSQPSSVTTNDQRQTSVPPPANVSAQPVSSTPSVPALFSTTPLSFSRRPELAINTANAQASKTASSRKRKSTQSTQEKSTSPTEGIAIPGTSASPTPTPQLVREENAHLPAQGLGVPIQPGPPPPSQNGSSTSSAPTTKRQRRRKATDSSSTAPTTTMSNNPPTMLAPLQQQQPPPNYPYGYGGYPPPAPYPAHYIPPNRAIWYQGYPPPPHHHHHGYPPPPSGPLPPPMRYAATNVQHPYQFQHPYGVHQPQNPPPHPPQHARQSHPSVPAQEPGNALSPQAGNGPGPSEQPQAEETPGSANSLPASPAGVQDQDGEPEIEMLPPDDEPMPSTIDDDVPSTNQPVNTPDVVPISAEPRSPTHPGSTTATGVPLQTRDAFWDNVKHVYESRTSQQTLSTSLQDRTPHGPAADNAEVEGVKVSSKAAKKICDTPSCLVTLPPKGYPFKLCSECRKKQKRKKKMGEIKRRFRLVGVVGSGSKTGGKSKDVAGAENDKEKERFASVGSDVDAEGDVDMDE